MSWYDDYGRFATGGGGIGGYATPTPTPTWATPQPIQQPPAQAPVTTPPGATAPTQTPPTDGGPPNDGNAYSLINGQWVNLSAQKFDPYTGRYVDNSTYLPPVSYYDATRGGIAVPGQGSQQPPPATSTTPNPPDSLVRSGTGYYGPAPGGGSGPPITPLGPAWNNWRNASGSGPSLNGGPVQSQIQLPGMPGNPISGTTTRSTAATTPTPNVNAAASQYQQPTNVAAPLMSAIQSNYMPSQNYSAGNWATSNPYSSASKSKRSYAGTSGTFGSNIPTSLYGKSAKF